MTSLHSLASSQPSRTLAPKDELLIQGAVGGDLFVLEDGELTVERDGIAVATISRPNSLVGEMSVLLGTPNTATVRAEDYVTVRVIKDARAQLLKDPELTFLVASLVAGRLNATTALLVELSKEHAGKAEQGLLGRILSAIHLPAADQIVERHDLFGGADGAFPILPPGR